MSTVKQTKQKMEAALEHLKNDLNGIRTGQANPAMLDGIMVEVYGSQMRLRDIATVNSPEARQLLITPYDAGTTNAIGKAIERANLGFMPIVDGNAVRLKIPPMDESLRKEMAKLCRKKQEEAKVTIRNLRRDANDLVRKQKAAGELPEDQMKKQEKEIQDLTDNYCKLADEIAAKKEKEISTI
ncbi:ribosome recycling factor [Parachlamydia sp. AcF125]|uniref:ribosome recycling factor n=1 Tax=Parachlamydia sp. AcF125 TaxID=2795736 RepID=UPI001BC97F12|nr:ribosome recycling factor [Parachlamydia sp. AcF125]MBS4167800.1 Ribosome-recycling factor [Parachlamydia sp. AcF125]